MAPRLLFSFGVACCLLLGILPCTAQVQMPEGRVADQNRHIWLVYNTTVRFAPKWGAYGEAQLRRSDGGSKPQQFLVRAALDRYVCQALTVSGGYGFQMSYPYGDFPAAERFPEHRFFEQVSLRDAVGRAQVQHRYRLEQRWIRRPGQDEFSYQNRFRYQLRLLLPLLGKSLAPGMPYAVASDELMINFGGGVRNVFDQNRLYGGLGYVASRTVNVEVGYLNQLLQQSNARVMEHNHTLQLSLVMNLDLRPDVVLPVCDARPAMD